MTTKLKRRTRNIKATRVPLATSAGKRTPPVAADRALPPQSLDRTIRIGAIVTAVLMVIGVAWMRFAWNAPTNPVTGLVVHSEASPLKTPPSRANLTATQKMYLELAESGASSAYTHDEWLKAQQHLMGRRSDVAVPLTQAALAAMPMTAPSAPEITRMAALPGFQIRINSQTTDTLVNSINEITHELPDKDARAFQKSVRMLMVNSLPIEEMVTKRESPSELSEARMLSGVRQTLSGMNALDVMKAAQSLHDKLVYQKSTNTGPFAPPAPTQARP